MNTTIDRRSLGNNRRADNEFRIEGDVAYIRLRSKRGEYEAKIDAKDLERVIGKGRWNLATVQGKYYYAVAYAKEDGKNGKVYLHRFLTDAPKERGIMVDHINGNTLDCRGANLRVVPHMENRKNTWHKRIRECPHCTLCNDHSSPYLND